MRALVTGGAGFVGRHLCKALLDRGWDVVCVDPVVQRTGGLSPANWPLYDPRGYARFTYVDQDCRDYFHLNEAFDYAFHLAAMVGGRLMIECDPLAVAEDLAIDADFFRYALRVKPKKVVFFSSSAAYPISLQRRENYILLREDMIDFRENIGMPDMSYGWAKLTGEYLARLAHQHYGLDVICYRPFSGYGEDQDLTYPFPSICRRALQSRGAPEITVWGTGDQMRDFIHIDDAVSFVLASVDSICNGDALNLSSGELTSFKRLASLATNAAGFDPVVVGTSDKPEGVFARGGDRARQEAIGLHPTVSLAEGMRRSVEYPGRTAGLKQEAIMPTSLAMPRRQRQRHFAAWHTRCANSISMILPEPRGRNFAIDCKLSCLYPTLFCRWGRDLSTHPWTGHYAASRLSRSGFRSEGMMAVCAFKALRSFPIGHLPNSDIGAPM